MTFVDRFLLQVRVDEELFEDADCRQAEATIAESHKEMVLHLLEDIEPVI